MTHTSNHEGKGTSQCQVCKHLECSKAFSDRHVYRCRIGRFDQDGFHCFYALSGIIRPNKAVAAAQKDCPDFTANNGE